MRTSLRRDAARRLGFAVLILAPALGACAPARAPIDWRSVEAEGRLVEKPEGLDVLEGLRAYRWTDGELELRVETVGGLLRKGPRLLADVRGGGDAATPFVLDTGSTASFLSATAPLAREARVARKSTFRVAHGQTHSGYLGHLPTVRMGPLAGENLTVGLIEQAHTSKDPTNILGIVHLFHTQLEHEGGRWWLRSGTARRPPTEPGWALVRLESGTPFVRVLDPAGKPLYAMIDTGAPSSHAVQGFPEGDYTVQGVDGAVALRIPVHDTVPWLGLEAGGYPISLLIGMDALSSRPCRLTFDRSAWSFPP